MAVTISAAELAAAIRVGDSTAETAEVARLLEYSTEAIATFLVAAYPTTPAAAVNEAVVRLAGFLYDQPTVSGRDQLANALRSSGAGAILLPYRIHRAGLVGASPEAATTAVGSAGNPVTGLSISGASLTVAFADGTTTVLTLPSGGNLLRRGA